MKPKILLLLLFSFLGSQLAIAQITTKNGAIVQYADGSVFIGQIVAEDEWQMSLVVVTGDTLHLAQSLIKRIHRNSKEILVHDRGKFHYKSGVFVSTTMGVGLSDNFSLSLGGEAVSLLVGEFPILFVTPKFSFPFNGGAFSVSTTLFTVPTNDFSTGGFLQGSLTLGNRRDNFTVGTGIGYGFSGGFNDGAVPVIVSGMKQVSEKISIVSENWFLTTFGDAFGIFSFGLRIHSQTKNNYLSVALLRTTFDQGDLIVWPFLSGVVVLK